MAAHLLRRDGQRRIGFGRRCESDQQAVEELLRHDRRRLVLTQDALSTGFHSGSDERGHGFASDLSGPFDPSPLSGGDSKLQPGGCSGHDASLRLL
jgi:hypothetical protein